MKRIVTILLSFGFLPGLTWGKAPHAEQNTTEQIQWHSFQWHSQNDFFEQTANQIMLLNLHIGGIPEVQTFIFSLATPFSFLYDHGYESMIYRNPAFASRVESVQRVSTMRDRVLRDLEISINRNLLGEDHMRIIPVDNGTRNDRIKGELGFGIFHRNRKILLIDNTQTRFARLENLPEEIEKNATFVPMRVEAGYIVLSLTIGNRPIDMFFDGSSRPALVTFHNRTHRQIISQAPTQEKLRHITSTGELFHLEGFQPAQEIFFNGLPLQNYGVYYSSEKAPGNIRGSVSQAFFSDYIMIFDYRNERFGLYKP